MGMMFLYQFHIYLRQMLAFAIRVAPAILALISWGVGALRCTMHGVKIDRRFGSVTFFF